MPKSFMLLDKPVIYHGLSSIIKEIYPLSTFFCTSLNSIALKEIKTKRFDLLICEINLAKMLNFSLLESIKQLKPEIRILILSAADEDVYALRYIHAGAHGYISKRSGIEDIKLAVRTVMNNNKYVSPVVMDKLLGWRPQNRGLLRLSNRELDITSLLVQGEGLLEISNLLSLHVATVSTYKIRIFRKLAVGSIAELIHLVHRSYVTNIA